MNGIDKQYNQDPVAISRPRAVLSESSELAARKRRQDELLDQALLETFPASDPISVMRIV